MFDQDYSGGSSGGARVVALPPGPPCDACGVPIGVCWLPGIDCDSGVCCAGSCQSCTVDAIDFDVWLVQVRIAMRGPSDEVMMFERSFGPFLDATERRARYEPLEVCELCGDDLNDGIDQHGGLWLMCPASDTTQGENEGHTNVLLSASMGVE